MSRSWPERLAKRIGRLSHGLDLLERKGRTSDKSYGKMLEELGDLCCQILEARDKANAELAQAKTEKILIQRRLAEERAKLKSERNAFELERDLSRTKRKAEEAETVRIQSELQKERQEMAEAIARANDAEHKFRSFIKTIDSAREKL